MRYVGSNHGHVFVYADDDELVTVYDESGAIISHPDFRQHLQSYLRFVPLDPEIVAPDAVTAAVAG